MQFIESSEIDIGIDDGILVRWVRLFFHYRVKQIITNSQGDWNDGVKNCLEEQFVKCYLKENFCQCGLYVVGCFCCAHWDDKDGRKKRAQRHYKDRLLKEFLEQQA
jgi:hypothetical protein